MGSFFNNISIRTRLIIMLIVVTVTSSAVIGLLGWRNGRDALNTTIFNQLNSIRSSKAFQVESYFRQTYSQIRTLSENRMIVNAMKQFGQGFDSGLYSSLSDQADSEVSVFYDDEFVPRIATTSENKPLSVLYQPNRTVARYFQYHYIVNNPYPPGRKDGLAESKTDTTIYNRFHKFYHPLFRNLLKEFRYYDIFLIDIKSLNIVYSVNKEVDFATSMQDGPHRESGLGVLVNRIKETPERGKVSIVDYRTYAPSYGAPASFVGVPVFDRNEAIGILAFQLPADELSRVMTAEGAWQDNGLGLTGESYLVGADNLMRSTSRLYEEDKDKYLSAIEKYGVSDETINRIRVFKSTVLMQPVVSTSVEMAFNEQSDTHTAINYYGQPVLSSFSQLRIPGLDWAIVSEISEDEAFSSVTQLQRTMLVWGVVLVLLVAFLAILLSQYFVRPVEKLTAGVNKLAGGDSTATIDIQSNDEFGELAKQFNLMVSNISDQSEVIDRKSAEYESLLANVLPAEIVDRYRLGEDISDNHQQVTVTSIEIDGLDEFAKQNNADAAASMLRLLVQRFDDAADRFDVSAVNVLGTSYLAACGLTTARLDHAKRSVDFSLAVLRIINQINNENNCRISLRIGIDSGSVMAAVFDRRRLIHTVWGHSVNMARTLTHQAALNTVLVSGTVHDRVSSLFDFNDVNEQTAKSYNSNMPMIFSLTHDVYAGTSDDSEQERA